MSPVRDAPPADLRGVSLRALLRELERRFHGDDAAIDLSGFSSRALATAMLPQLISLHGSNDLVNLPGADEALPERLGVLLDDLRLADAARLDYLAALRADEEGVAVLFDRADLGELIDGHYRLRTTPLRQRFDLCDPRFAREPCLPGARGSGFLVARFPALRRSRWLATASHCVAREQLADTVVSFAFDLLAVRGDEVWIPVDEVYALRGEVQRCADDDPADWLLLELDRDVVGRTIRPLDDGPLAEGRRVHISGHPLGLPRKLAGHAVVRDNSDADHFKANLDAYGGNSGSPIFDSETHAIVGLLVSGQEDFMPTFGCKLDQCMLDQCPGETCTRVARFAEFIPMPAL